MRRRRCVEAAGYERITSREIAYFHTRYPGIEGVIVSSVVNDSREMIDYLGSLFPTCIELDHATPLPLVNRYRTPDTLGYDRIAAAVGAYTIFPGKTVLVIDAGTAITYDIVTAGGEYLGGNISPGLEIRFKSLNKYTNRLPLLERPEKNLHWLEAVHGRPSKPALLMESCSKWTDLSRPYVRTILNYRWF